MREVEELGAENEADISKQIAQQKAEIEQLKAAHKGAIERKELPGTATLGQLALRWILDTEGATCVIPGARTIEQVEGNLGACGLPKVSEEVNKQVKEVYDATVKAVIEKEKW